MTPPILAPADEARMAAQYEEVLAAIGTTCSIQRIVRDGSDQGVPAAAHLTGVPVVVSPMNATTELIYEAPAGERMEARIKKLTVPDDLQESDLLTTADGIVYQVLTIRPFRPFLLLALLTRRDLLTTSP